MDKCHIRPKEKPGHLRFTIYDLRFGKFPRLRANLAKFAVLLTYFLCLLKTHGKWVE